MLAGSTADRVGRRRTFQVGLGVFTIGSLLCSLAPSLGALVAFRMVQAVGGSMLNPVAMSIITNTFTERRERARAIGIWGGVVGLSMALGPVVGGVLVSTVGWRSIFWVNIPVGIAAIILTAVFVPESRAPRARRFDPVGQVLIMLTLATLVYGIIEGPGHGWGSPLIVGCFAVAAAAGTAFAWYEMRRRDALLDVRFFRSAPFAGATVIAVSAFAGLGGFLLLNTIYLQDVRGLSALHAGLYMLPMAAMTAVCSPLSGRIVGSRGPRLPLIGAGIAITVSAITLTRLSAGTSTLSLVISLPAVRAGLRAGQRAHHEHRHVRHAACPGRRGRGRRVDEPAGRLVARRRGDRICGGVGAERPHQDGVRDRQSRGVVGAGRLRRRGARAWRRDDGPLGQAHGRPGRRRVRPCGPKRPSGSNARRLGAVASRQGSDLSYTTARCRHPSSWNGAGTSLSYLAGPATDPRLATWP